MIPWANFLKWLLQPKNALLVLLTILVVILSVAVYIASGALGTAKGQVADLTVKNGLYAAQVDELNANIENIKKLAGKVQVIERNTHTIREIVKQVPAEDTNCEKSPEFKEAAMAVVDYFNSDGGGMYKADNAPGGTPILPTPGKANSGGADD